MNGHKFTFTLLLTSASLFSFSQNEDSLKVEPTAVLNLKISYNSSLIYPGTRIGAEFLVKTVSSPILNEPKNKKGLLKERFITANSGWYHQPYFHDNLYITVGWLMRRTKQSGFFTEFSPEIGVSRTFIGGTTYQVDASGKVSVEKFAGYYYALFSVGAGIGYDFSIRKKKPLMVFYKINLISMYPYNSTIYFRPAMELGIIYRFSMRNLIN